MSYSRRVLHFSSDPTNFQSLISDRAVAGCSFELNRLGGCGAGELQLNDKFANRNSIQVGDWIAFEYSEGVRWYTGRVEHRSATVPTGVSLRLEGMSVQLGELFAGGFHATAGQLIPPHRYAKSDLFPNDPDHGAESINTISEPRELVLLLMQQYVVPQSDILLDTTLVETLTNPASVSSMKFRGEESIKDVIKDLAMRAGHASWGVQPDGKFFYLQKPTTTAATWRVGRDIISLEETRERNQLYNRLMLTGGYVYDEPVNSSNEARGIYRWRGNYTQPTSRTAHGERRIRMNIPWIRTATDSRAFAKEFFRVYAEPTIHYILDVGDQTAIPFPWEGRIKIEDENGGEIITSAVESIRVQFDHAPRFQIHIGPDDPQIHWSEPPFNERWEVPSPMVGNPVSYGGEEISVTSFIITDPPDPSSSSVTSSSSYYSSSSSSSSSYYSSSLSSSSGSSTPLTCSIAHDTFTAINSVLLESHTMNTGNGWVVHAGTWDIQNHKAQCSHATTGLVTTTTIKSNVKISSQVTLSAGGTPVAGLLFRVVDASNFWVARIDQVAGRLELVERINSTETVRESDNIGTVNLGDVYDLEVRCDGNVIQVDLDGIQRISHTAAITFLSETKHGIYSDTANTTYKNLFDDFCIENQTISSPANATLVYDQFTGENASLVSQHTPDIDTVGGGYLATINGWIINNNQARYNDDENASYDDRSLWIDVNNANVDISVNVDIDPTGDVGHGVAGILFRVQDVNNHWLAEIFSSGNVKLWERTAGTWTQRGSTVTVTASDSYAFRVTVDSSHQMTVYVDDISKITHTSSIHSTKTKHGLYGTAIGEPMMGEVGSVDFDEFKIVAM